MAQYTVERIDPSRIIWTVMKDGKVYSGPHFSKRSAKLAAKNAARREQEG